MSGNGDSAVHTYPVRWRVATLALLLAAGGCATDYGVRPSWILKDADFRGLRPGMSATQVEGILGSPLLRTPLPRLREVAWDYRYFDVQTPMKALLHFDMNGVLKRHTQGYDHEYDHGGAER